LLSGLVHITLPGRPEEALIMEGLHLPVVAANTTDVGYYTSYRSGNETVAEQIPFLERRIPEHRVLTEGSCHSASVRPCGLTNIVVEELK
jgi:hypothetical protein